MRKIKIRLPATISNFGPGPNNLGLALGLYTTVEISGNETQNITLELKGMGADLFPDPLRHPVVLAISRYFQTIEKSILGINIRVDNRIPLRSGLGVEAAFTLAGIMGANTLMGDLYSRPEVLEMAAVIGGEGHTVAALLGGLVTTMIENEHLTHQTLPVGGFQVVVVVPAIEKYVAPDLPGQVSWQDVRQNMIRLPLLLDALRRSDLVMMSKLLDDSLTMPSIAKRIPGLSHVSEIAQRFGALKVIPCGIGPAVLALIESRHEALAEEMQLAFNSAGVEATTYVLPVDTQGVVISIVQTA